MKFFIAFVALLIIAFITRVISLLFKKASESNSLGEKIVNYEPLIALTIWIGYIFWVVNYLFYDKTYYNFIVFALIVLLLVSISWFFVKDFLAGIAFKLQNNYVPGDTVQFGEISGRLEHLFLTHVSIFTGEGKLVKIPYSRLSNAIISQKSKGTSSGANKFTLKVPKNRTAEDFISSISLALMNSPWRLPNRSPSVKLKIETEEFYEFEIQFETRATQHDDYVKAYLIRSFGN